MRSSPGVDWIRPKIGQARVGQVLSTLDHLRPCSSEPGQKSWPSVCRTWPTLASGFFSPNLGAQILVEFFAGLGPNRAHIGQLVGQLLGRRRRPCFRTRFGPRASAHGRRGHEPRLAGAGVLTCQSRASLVHAAEFSPHSRTGVDMLCPVWALLDPFGPTPIELTDGTWPILGGLRSTDFGQHSVELGRRLANQSGHTAAHRAKLGLVDVGRRWVKFVRNAVTSLNLVQTGTHIG